MKQPFCRWCGKPIRKFVRNVYIERAPSPHHTTGRHVRYVYGEARTKADCQKFTNGIIVSVKRAQTPEFIRSFGEWDGESYVDEFFCSTTTCAVKMGYAAARQHGLSRQAYRDAQREFDAAERAREKERCE